MRYQSIRSIFPTLALDRNEIDEYRILDWATEAYESLNVKTDYENKVAILNVENHKAILPYGLNHIMSVTYLKNKSFSQSDLDSICSILSSDDATTCGCTPSSGRNGVIDSDINPSTYKPTFYAPNQYNIQRIKVQGIINNYSLWVRSPFYKNNFELMRLRNRPYANQIHCTDCPNTSCLDCEYTYNISKDGEIITEFEDGIVCIAYRSIPLDDEGLVKIPDDPDVRKAINAYVSAKHWELRWNLKEEGSYDRYMTFLGMAEKLMMKVKGKLGLKNLDYDGIRFITDRYKHLINQPVVWNFNPGVYLE